MARRRRYAELKGIRRKAIAVADLVDELLRRACSWLFIDRDVPPHEKRVSIEDTIGQVLTDHEYVRVKGPSAASLRRGTYKNNRLRLVSLDLDLEYSLTCLSTSSDQGPHRNFAQSRSCPGTYRDRGPVPAGDALQDC